MTEHAIAIARVSTGVQHEEDQRPGLIKYAQSKGYTLDHIVAVHGKSAFHGRHVKDVLNAVEQYVRHGRATVVIFRHVDRASREGIFKGIDLMNKIMSAGARIEFSEQPFLTDNPGWIGMLMELAKADSQTKKDRTEQGNAVRRANGRLIGRVPWGYDPVYGPGARAGAAEVQIGIKPNALGREWIPAIFDAAIHGKSYRQICEEMLEACDVPSPQNNGLWGASAVALLLSNTTYYGVMKGNPFLEFEPLITIAVYRQAHEALANRRKQGRSATKHEAALIRPTCAECYGVKREGAPSGKSPMYLRRWKQYTYFACFGHGSRHKSCGAKHVRGDELERLVDETMAADDRPRIVRVPVDGDDNDERREVLKEKISAAMAANEFAVMAELTKELMAVEPSKTVSRVEDRRTGKTVGQHWQTLSRAQKREELANWLVLARQGEAGPEVRLMWRSPWETASIDR